MNFTLTILPSGRSILSTERSLPPEAHQQIREAFTTWRESDEGSLIVASCAVHHAESVELDIPLVVANAAT